MTPEISKERREILIDKLCSELNILRITLTSNKNYTSINKN